jgi:CRISPR-associated protein Cmr2
MAYLFEVHIGPVQGFIASARRTGDLYFGSHLLSELSKAAARHIEQSEGELSLIFPPPISPAELAPESALNVANKIVALVQSDPHQLGDKVYQAILRRLHDIKTKAYKHLKGSLTDPKKAEAQIDDLVEYYWVAVPYEEPYYDAARDRLETLMAARKNTHNFKPVSWGGNVPKSSIDGQLESVIPETEYVHYREKPTQQQILKTIKALYDSYRAGPAERLSGVDLLKRLGSWDVFTVPSTSHMAALSYLKRLEKLYAPLGPAREADVKAKWDAYIKEAEKLSPRHQVDFIPNSWSPHVITGKVDGSLLFEERLVDLVGDIQAIDKEQLKKAKKALLDFYNTLDTSRPDPYYAILVADGDSMGVVINALSAEGYDRHRALSQGLDGFAKRAHEIIEDKNYQGAPVYTGGDDVLALLPLHTALACAGELSKGFKDRLSSFKNTEGVSPTLSVGIAVVHHLHPLSDALAIARAAEQRAKQVTGKDALAIAIRKRSGGEYTVKGRWGMLDKHLEKLIGYYAQDAIPDGMAFEMQESFNRLNFNSSEPIPQQAGNLMRDEIKRILRRKLQVSDKKEEDTSDEQKQAREIYEYLSHMAGILPSQHAREVKQELSDLEDFIQTLLVARIFSETRKLAGM